jgi:hypothetical protein
MRALIKSERDLKCDHVRMMDMHAGETPVQRASRSDKCIEGRSMTTGSTGFDRLTSSGEKDEGR